MMIPSVAISSVAGKTRAEVLGDRAAGGDRHAEVAGQHVAHVGEELHDERPVEPHLDPRRLVDLRGGAVAHHRQHRVDRHHAADEEGDGEEAEEGERHHHDEAAEAQCGAPGRARGGGGRARAGCRARRPSGRTPRCRILLGEYTAVCLNGEQSAVGSDGQASRAGAGADHPWGSHRCDTSDPFSGLGPGPAARAARRRWRRRPRACWSWRRTSTTSSPSTRPRPTSSPPASSSPTSTTGWCSTTPRTRRCWRPASPANGRSTPRPRPSPSPCATAPSSTPATRCAPRTWSSPSPAW